MSNRDSARKMENRAVGRAVTLRTQHRPRMTSLSRERRAPFPASQTQMTMLSAHKSSSTKHKLGKSAINRPRFSGTRRRDPLWAWYHLSFRFSHWPIRARHSSTPLGGIFRVGALNCTHSFTANVLLVWSLLSACNGFHYGNNWPTHMHTCGESKTKVCN